jgi:hypothetical protein
MKWFFAVFLVAVSGMAVFGQQNNYAGHGYVHYGVAGARRDFKTVYTVGVGGDGFVYKGLAAGASIEMLSAYKNIAATAGLLSPTASWHFVDRKKDPKVVPFVNGGYSLAFSTRGHDSGFHFGGGVHWWFKPKYALRAGVQDHVFHGQHLTVFQIGLAFR